MTGIDDSLEIKNKKIGWRGDTQKSICKDSGEKIGKKIKIVFRKLEHKKACCFIYIPYLT